MNNTVTGNATSQSTVKQIKTQRQHVRVKLPIVIIIRSKQCEAIDWSHNGLAFDASPLKAAHIQLKHEDMFDATLSLSFKNFGLTVPLGCEVRHVNADGSRVGCRFHRMDKRNISLLQYLVKAHVSGSLVQIGDILDVVADKQSRAVQADSLQDVSDAHSSHIASNYLFVAIILALLTYIAFMSQGA